MSRRSGCSKDLEFKGEKYVRVSVDVSDGRISRVYIRGDFFCYPEDAVERLEMALIGIPVGEVRRIFMEIMGNAELVGIGKEGLLRLIQEAASCG